MNLPRIIIGITTFAAGFVLADWLAMRSAKARNHNKAGGIFKNEKTELD